MPRRHRKFFAFFAALAAAACLAAGAFAQQEPIKVGDVQAYSAVPQGTEPYRKGWEMALDEVNAAGGVLGRKLEVVSRDDAGKPDVATQMAQELVTNEKVALFFVRKSLAIRDEELHVADLGAIDGGVVDLIQDAVRAGEPRAAGGRVGGADGVLDARGPAGLEAGRTKGFALLVEPTIEGLIVHRAIPFRGMGEVKVC